MSFLTGGYSKDADSTVIAMGRALEVPSGSEKLLRLRGVRGVESRTTEDAT